MTAQAGLNITLFKAIWAEVSPPYGATNNDAALMFQAIANLFKPSSYQQRHGGSDLTLSTTLDAQIEQLSTCFPEHLAPLFRELAKLCLEMQH